MTDGSITYSATKVDNFLTNLRSGTIDANFNIDTDLSIFARTYVSALAGGNTTGVCPTSYGIVLTFRGNGNTWIWQIAISTDNTKFIRQNINNSGWDTWRQF